MSQKITRDEWLSALQDARETNLTENADAMTATEYAHEYGVHWATARRRMNELVFLGKAERVLKWMKRADGSQVRVSAYRLIGGKK